MKPKNTDFDKSYNIIGFIIIPILILSVLGQHFIFKSEEYITRKYFEFHIYQFRGEIYEKTEDQKGAGSNEARYVILTSGTRHRISTDKYQELSIGDIVYKNSKSDTVYYILKNSGDTLKFMENQYLSDYKELQTKANNSL